MTGTAALRTVVPALHSAPNDSPNAEFGRCKPRSTDVTCPYRCGSSQNCQIKACGDKRGVIRGFVLLQIVFVVMPVEKIAIVADRSVEPTLPVNPLPGEDRGVVLPIKKGTCPSGCTADPECHVKGCGLKLICDKNTYTCTAPYDLCPTSCQSDSDCKASGCGNKLSV